uniref:Uncharacterized protein n=1 Tax=Romanomermis culicivorax TaxID=13658 RepID=A0A915JYD9_ROMCU
MSKAIKNIFLPKRYKSGIDRQVSLRSVKQDLRAAHEQEIFKLYVDEFRHLADSKLGGYKIDVENLQPVYDHAKAVFRLWYMENVKTIMLNLTEQL